MKGVNQGVRAWNWTTGKTKADLANGMINSASILIGIGAGMVYYDHDRSVASLVIPMLMGSGLMAVVWHPTKTRNREMEQLEVKAHQNGLMNLKVETRKNMCKFGGQLVLLLATTGEFLGPAIHPGHDFMWCSYGLLVGPSYYVMRADCLPPKKNALARGWDKAKELLRELNTAPSPVPAPALGLSVLRRV